MRGDEMGDIETLKQEQLKAWVEGDTEKMMDIYFMLQIEEDKIRKLEVMK